MIRSCKDRDTQALLEGRAVRRFSHLRRQIEKRLRILEAADTLEALRALPGNRLEALSGDRKGQFSIRVNEQWRLCFRWEDGAACDVEIADYH